MKLVYEWDVPDSKCHAEELVQAGKTLDLVVSAVAQNAFAEIVHGQKVHQLRKNSAADIHRPFLFAERNWNGYIAGKMANASESNCLRRIDHRRKKLPYWDFPKKIEIDFEKCAVYSFVINSLEK